MSRLSYGYCGFDLYEGFDASYVVIVDDKPVRSFPTREAAKKWIAEEFHAQSAWKRRVQNGKGKHDEVE